MHYHPLTGFSAFNIRQLMKFQVPGSRWCGAKRRCLVTFALPNVAIAILVNRLLDPQLWRTRLLFVMAVLQVLLALVPCIIVYVQCRPIEKLWNPTLPGHCWDSSVLNDITYFMTAYTIITDIALAVMPITAFWKLHMKPLTKLGLCFMIRPAS